MSDLETGNGLSIRQDIVAAYTPGMEKQIQFKWPQEKPTIYGCRVWKENCRISLLHITASGVDWEYGLEKRTRAGNGDINRSMVIFS